MVLTSFYGVCGKRCLPTLFWKQCEGKARSQPPLAHSRELQRSPPNGEDIETFNNPCNNYQVPYAIDSKSHIFFILKLNLAYIDIVSYVGSHA